MTAQAMCAHAELRMLREARIARDHGGDILSMTVSGDLVAVLAARFETLLDLHWQAAKRTLPPLMVLMPLRC